MGNHSAPSAQFTANEKQAKYSLLVTPIPGNVPNLFGIMFSNDRADCEIVYSSADPARICLVFHYLRAGMDHGIQQGRWFLGEAEKVRVQAVGVAMLAAYGMRDHVMALGPEAVKMFEELDPLFNAKYTDMAAENAEYVARAQQMTEGLLDTMAGDLLANPTIYEEHRLPVHVHDFQDWWPLLQPTYTDASVAVEIACAINDRRKLTGPMTCGMLAYYGHKYVHEAAGGGWWLVDLGEPGARMVILPPCDEDSLPLLFGDGKLDRFAVPHKTKMLTECDYQVDRRAFCAVMLALGNIQATQFDSLESAYHGARMARDHHMAKRRARTVLATQLGGSALVAAATLQANGKYPDTGDGCTGLAVDMADLMANRMIQRMTQNGLTGCEILGIVEPPTE